MSRKDVFVQRCIDYCRDDSHGYSQTNDRFGHPDFDCSGLMYQCGYEAGYDLPTSGTRYTGTMLEHFKAAGFTAVPFDGNVGDLEPGDIVLNVGNHVEMCVMPGYFGGAHIDENGNVAGGIPGDQTGNEVSICPAYVYSDGWDWVLTPPSDDGEAATPAPAAVPAAPKPQEPCYRVFRDGKWRAWKCGGQSAGKKGHAIYDVSFDGLGPNGWFQLTLEGGEVLRKNWHNTKRSKAVIGVTVYYDTPEPGKTGYYEALYRVHALGGSWLKWEHDDDDGGAGDDAHPIDVLQLRLEKCG